jgi:hypothetical protein
MRLKKFNELFENNENKMYNNLDELLDAYDINEIDQIETDIDDFVHPDPMDDFDYDYVINDENIKIEKELICYISDDEELFIYTDNNNSVHGWAINID